MVLSLSNVYTTCLGNMAEDFFVVLFLYPCAAVQMWDHMEAVEDGTWR